MKKRLLAWLCLLALLTACTPVSPAPDAQTLPPATEEAAASATRSPGAEPAETLALSGSVTAGGFRVYTDGSAYSPRSGSGAQYTRLREGALQRFEASPDYGAVYPYAASRLYGTSTDGYPRGGDYRYGFMDRSGRILTDGVYCLVYSMTWYDRENDQSLRQPFWIVGQQGEVTIHHWEDGEASGSWAEADTHFGVISMDGSFALDCVYEAVESLQEGFVCVEDRSEYRFSVYDGSGNRRFGSEELLENLDVNWYELEYGDGLYCLNLVLETGVAGEYEYRCLYLNADGTPILEGYRAGSAFRDGLACVSRDGRHFGYIDKTGAWVIEDRYGLNNSFRDGLVIQESPEDGTVLLDTQGKVVLTAPAGGWLERDRAGFRVNRGESEDYALDCYDRSGAHVISGNNTLRRLDEDTFCYTDWEDGKTHVVRPAAGAELKISQQDYMEPGVWVRDGALCFGYVGQRYQNEVWTFVEQDLSSAGGMKQSGSGASQFFDRTALDPCTGELWYLCRSEGDWLGLSESGAQFRLRVQTEDLVPRGGLLYAVTDEACCYYSLSGDLIFRYPLDAED